MTDPLSELDDTSLIRQSLQGGEASEAAFRELFDRYKGRVLAFVMQRVSNYHDAQEITQDVFIEAGKNLAKFRGDSTFLTFLNGIAKYRCRNYWRSLGRQRKAMEALTDPSLVPEPPPTPLEILIRAEEQQRKGRRLENAVEQLKEPFRTAVRLRLIEYKSYKEITTIMGCSIGTVASRLDRGFDDLMKWLRENPDDV